MGIELSELRKDVDNFIVLEPYSEEKIEDKDWEVYKNKEGELVELSKEWRKIKFKCHYPSNDRLKKLSSFMRGTVMLGGQGLGSYSDIKEGVRYIVNNVITDVEDISSDGKRLVYQKNQKSKNDACAKDVIEDQFLKSPLLLEGFITDYQSQAGKLKGAVEDFLDSSDTSSKSNSDSKRTTKTDSTE